MKIVPCIPIFLAWLAVAVESNATVAAAIESVPLKHLMCMGERSQGLAVQPSKAAVFALLIDVSPVRNR
jgi:hypothetical protein